MELSCRFSFKSFLKMVKLMDINYAFNNYTETVFGIDYIHLPWAFPPATPVLPPYITAT